MGTLEHAIPVNANASEAEWRCLRAAVPTPATAVADGRFAFTSKVGFHLDHRMLFIEMYTYI